MHQNLTLALLFSNLAHTNKTQYIGMKVAVEEKLRRIMLIRSNKREVNAAAHNGASNHRKCFNKNSPRWYSNERNEAHYDSFYRYRTKYDNYHSDENRNNADL